MKNTVIVGGSSGIGLSLAQKLSERGENVFCISKSPCPVSGVTNSVVDVLDTDALFAAIYGIDNIDALVYCAGISLASSVEFADDELIEELIDVNLTCAVLSCKAALRNMRSGGRITLLSSTGGIVPIAFDAPYSASKAGLIKFAETLDLELDERNITCTAAVVPATRTRFSFKRNVADENEQGEYGKRMKAAANALIKIEQTGYTSDYVADKIIGILDSSAPPPVVTIGAKNRFSVIMYRILPRCIKKKILRATYDI